MTSSIFDAIREAGSPISPTLAPEACLTPTATPETSRFKLAPKTNSKREQLEKRRVALRAGKKMAPQVLGKPAPGSSGAKASHVRAVRQDQGESPSRERRDGDLVAEWESPPASPEVEPRRIECVTPLIKEKQRPRAPTGRINLAADWDSRDNSRNSSRKGSIVSDQSPRCPNSYSSEGSDGDSSAVSVVSGGSSPGDILCSKFASVLKGSPEDGFKGRTKPMPSMHLPDPESSFQDLCSKEEVALLQARLDMALQDLEKLEQKKQEESDDFEARLESLRASGNAPSKLLMRDWDPDELEDLPSAGSSLRHRSSVALPVSRASSKLTCKGGGGSAYGVSGTSWYGVRICVLSMLATATSVLAISIRDVYYR